ncbi:hypothetical protein K1719_021411 [Acacia pycnantha]|nr:hypothetical protein K1719_021411 [Acacia pycnantha]
MYRFEGVGPSIECILLERGGPQRSSQETKWRQDRINEMLEEKVQPYIQNMNNAVLYQPIFLQQQTEEKKKRRRQRRWFFF